MAREILGEFGPEIKKGPANKPGGATMHEKGYAHLTGPTQGSGMENCGNAGTQGSSSARGDGSSGSPGLGGTNHGSCGTQGRH